MDKQNAQETWAAEACVPVTLSRPLYYYVPKSSQAAAIFMLLLLSSILSIHVNSSGYFFRVVQ